MVTKKVLSYYQDYLVDSILYLQCNDHLKAIMAQNTPIYHDMCSEITFLSISRGTVILNIKNI